MNNTFINSNNKRINLQQMVSTNSIIQWFNQNVYGDRVIWGIALILSSFSILVVYSATGSLAFKQFGGNTEYFLIKQVILVISMLFLIGIVHKIKVEHFYKFSKIMWGISLVLLIYVQFSGLSINSATRWISVPIINQKFQPSDFAVFAVIVIMATFLSMKRNKKTNYTQFLISLLSVSGIIIALIAISNISSALLLALICSLMILIGKVKMNIKRILIIIGVSCPLILVTVFYGERGATAVHRFKTYLDAKQIPFQEEQAYIAIAGGEFFGKGPGQSHQKNLLPYAYSDFIFPIIIEEYGLIGGLIVIVLYLIILYRCLRISEKTKHSFGKYLVLGLGFSLVIQAFTNMAVSVGIGPITGIPLPFLSMGGTSLLFSGLSIGIILSVSRENTKTKHNG